MCLGGVGVPPRALAMQTFWPPSCKVPGNPTHRVHTFCMIDLLVQLVLNLPGFSTASSSLFLEGSAGGIFFDSEGASSCAQMRGPWWWWDEAYTATLQKTHSLQQSASQIHIWFWEFLISTIFGGKGVQGKSKFPKVWGDRLMCKHKSACGEKPSFKRGKHFLGTKQASKFQSFKVSKVQRFLSTKRKSGIPKSKPMGTLIKAKQVFLSISHFQATSF